MNILYFRACEMSYEVYIKYMQTILPNYEMNKIYVLQYGSKYCYRIA